MSMDTVWVSLAKSEQVFLCCNQLNSFNGTDLFWALKVGRKSFIQTDKVLSNDFKVLLSHIIIMFLKAVVGHVRLVI